MPVLMVILKSDATSLIAIFTLDNTVTESNNIQLILFSKNEQRDYFRD